MKSGIQLIADERARQLKPRGQGGEGWSPEHDAQHKLGELAGAAACYALKAAGFIDPQNIEGSRLNLDYKVPIWPFGPGWWKPKDPVADLVRAGALAAAELDRHRGYDGSEGDQCVITCVYCGQEYPTGTPTHGAKILTDHIKVCEKHPMRKLEADLAAVRKAMFNFIGAESVEELKGIANVIRQQPDGENKTLALDAIQTLIATEPQK